MAQHRRQTSHPIWPTCDVVVIKTPQILLVSEIAMVDQFTNEQIDVGVDDGVHHHVNLTRTAQSFDDGCNVF